MGLTHETIVSPEPLSLRIWNRRGRRGIRLGGSNGGIRTDRCGDGCVSALEFNNQIVQVVASPRDDDTRDDVIGNRNTPLHTNQGDDADSPDDTDGNT